jgi:hypothetical protein
VIAVNPPVEEAFENVRFVVEAFVAYKVVTVAFVILDEDAVSDVIVVVARVEVPCEVSDEVAVIDPPVILPPVSVVTASDTAEMAVATKEVAVVVARVLVPPTVSVVRVLVTAFKILVKKLVEVAFVVLALVTVRLVIVVVASAVVAVKVFAPAMVWVDVEITPRAVAEASGTLRVCVVPTELIATSVPDVPTANVCVTPVRPFNDEIPDEATERASHDDPE